MSNERGQRSSSTRRGFLTSTAGLAAAAGAALGGGAAAEAEAPANSRLVPELRDPVEPFWGAHQGGILTPLQAHSYFAAFDLVTTKRDDVVKLLQAWTKAAARMTRGLAIEPFAETQIAAAADLDTTTTTTTTTTTESYDTGGTATTTVAAPDSGETMGLTAARLTVTFGFGPGLFVKDGADRYGLARQRPEAFVDMPRFVGDQLVPEHTGGDLSVQACADDPQVAFHAVRQLARIAGDAAQVRWTQAGFMPRFSAKETPRNLMGFRDGTNNPQIGNADDMADFVMVGDEGPLWMRGGSYMVVRRIRIALEHWDRTQLAFQEQTIGRHKASGAPLGRKNEFDALDLQAAGKDGNPLTPENAHVRLAAAESNGGARILRRPYSYNDGVNFTAERWPPWRQGMEYDAGLFFLCYQRDPRTGFLKIYERMSKVDMMNQFATHVGGGLFACPGGIAEGEFVGQRLFERA
jgi:deferrochelatase/peroxidase EfeB